MVPPGADVRTVGSATLGYKAKPGQGWLTSTDPVFVVMIANRRVDAIEGLIKGRHGGACDTDDGGIYWTLALPHLLALLSGQFERCDPLRWGRRWTPRFLAAIGETRAELHIASHLRRPRFRSNEVFGKELRITAAECARYRLIGVAPWDVPPEQRQADRLAADAKRQRARRAAKGAKARDLSDARQRPWEREGISESTWRRRKRKAAGGDRNSSAQLSTRVGGRDNNCPDEKRSRSPPDPTPT